MKAYILFVLVSSLVALRSSAQDTSGDSKEDVFFIGAAYSHGDQDYWPFGDSTYLYQTNGIKMSLNYLLLNRGPLFIEGILEPAVFITDHQLLNPFFLGLGNGADYLQQRKIYSQPRTFVEIVMSVGFITKFQIAKHVGFCLVGTTGPMVGTESTERLKDGLAFSHVGGAGFSYAHQNWRVDLRTYLRHNSNANIWSPNSGHNSSGLEIGVGYKL